MGRAVIMYDDRVPAATLSGTAPVSTLPLTNMQDPQPRKVARWSATTAYMVADFGAAAPIGLVALSGTNLTTSATRRVRLSSADATGAAGDVHDSGTAGAGADIRYNGTVIYHLSADASARYLRVDITDATLTWLDVGLFLAGPGFRPSRNFQYGMSLGYQEFGIAEASPIGVRFASRRGRGRAISLRFDFASEVEAMTNHIELARMSGGTENIVVVPDPDGTYKAQQAIVGLVDDVSEIKNTLFKLWSRTINVVERI